MELVVKTSSETYTLYPYGTMTVENGYTLFYKWDEAEQAAMYKHPGEHNRWEWMSDEFNEAYAKALEKAVVT